MTRATTVIFALALIVQTSAQDMPLPSKERFHLYVLAGQSNMAGRGSVEAGDKAPHQRVLMLSKEMKWVPASDPMHFDKPIAGVGPGLTFGRVIAEAQPDITVGLIPCAVGGSPIETWTPGAYYVETKSHPWDDMIERLHAAQRTGMLKGILWHQGESDCNPERAPAYEKRLHELIARLREAVKSPNLPFIAGQIGRFQGTTWTPSHDLVDQAHRDLPMKVPHTAFVESTGLKDKGDKLHFDAVSAREFGQRYATEFLKLNGKD